MVGSEKVVGSEKWWGQRSGGVRVKCQGKTGESHTRSVNDVQ
ncbi:MAG: hypothetical protein ACI9UU_002327, partial [Candidatus Azotimanducaceae bacterium]